MIEIAIMIEGQHGLNWPRWQRVVRAVEDLGFAGLYRSDHYTNPNPPDLDSLELWVSLTWLAGNTSRIEFGPLVTPLSFRNPTMTARMAAAVDDLSGGRMTLGLGAGWQEREHTHYGWDLLDLPERFARFEEGLHVISGLLESDEPLDFSGHYYRLQDAVLLPRPHRPGGPPILIGGNGPRYTLPLAARFASHWNAVFIPAGKFREINAQLDQMLLDAGRKPAEVTRSMMTGCVFGRDQAEVERAYAKRSPDNRDLAWLLDRGFLVGTAGELVDQLGVLAEAGVQQVMLQWLDPDDIDGLESLAMDVLGALG